MQDDDLPLLFELFESTPRQGPGSVASTHRALTLLPDGMRIERVLDLGCGTGASTLVLAEDTGAQITAVDIHPPFLETLRGRAAERGVAGRITTLVADMSDTDVLGDGYDLVWAEGSAYNIGFTNALRLWRPLLRPGGCLVVSELVWFTAEPAARAVEFFTEHYPEMGDEAQRLGDAREAGYEVLGSFRLPPGDWHAYYDGVDEALQDAVRRHGEREIYAATRLEKEIYAACGDDYGYVCLALRVPE